MKDLEHFEQVALVQWLRIKKIPHNATPNGGYRNIATAVKLKAEGVVAGFPDITIFLPNLVLYIEMKRRGGTVQKNQKEWIDYLNSLPYAKAVICYGAKEAINIIEEITK